jgi:hypothetical protein
MLLKERIVTIPRGSESSLRLRNNSEHKEDWAIFFLFVLVRFCSVRFAVMRAGLKP